VAYVLDPQLREYATEDQWRKLQALEKAGNQRDAAKLAGCARAGIQRAIHSVTKKAAQHGFAPEHGLRYPVPIGYTVSGVSSLVDTQTGDTKLQWIKTKADDEAREQALQEAIQAMAEDIPRVKAVAAPKVSLEELVNLYVLTDFHWAALAWHREGGSDWDLDIAEKVLLNGFSQMMAQSPDSETCIIGQLGDFIHTDYPGFKSQTPLSGHDLDTDGRPHKVIGGAIRVTKMLINMALIKHKKVVVLLAEGNHDGMGSVWLQHCFAAMYENEPRVEVICTPLPYYCYEHGETMLAFHHGHLRKPTALTGVFAAQFAPTWGRTRYRYGHCGHLHHKVVISEREDAGMTITQHRSLTAKDAYSARGGYSAERKTECLTYHKKYGLVGSVHVTPEMCE